MRKNNAQKKGGRKKSSKNVIKLIRKSNELVEARYKFDIWETRVFTKMLTMVQRHDSDFQEYRIYLKEIVKDFQIENNKDAYDRLRAGGYKLMSKIIKTIRDTDEGLMELATPIVVGVQNPVDTKSEGAKFIDVSFHPEMKPFLLSLKSKFTIYDVRNILKLPSSYSIRIYELLKQYEKIGRRKFELQELKEIIGVIEEVDNNGNAYVLGKHYFEKRKDSRRDAPNYEFVLETYTEIGEQKDKYQLNSKEKFISNLTFEVNSKEQIICTGFYSDVKPRGGISDSRNTKGTIRGIVFFSIDNVNKIIAEKTYSEFDLGFIALNESEKQKRSIERRATDGNDNNDPGLFSYDFRDVILRSDGGAVVIAEQYFAYDRFNDPFFNGGLNRGFSNNGFRQDSTHVFSDIIVVNIDPDGSIRWANAVPKYQSSFNYDTYRFLSFGSANYRDEIYMLFNERVDLFESDAGGGGLLKSRASNYGLAMATIDKSGELDIKLLAPNREMGVQVLPTLIKQIGKKELLFYGEGGDMFRLGKVELN